MGTYSPDQRTAVVSGAAGGLGFAVTELLLERGTQVSMVDVDAQRLAEATDRLQGEPQALLADLSRTAECDRVIAEAEGHWGRIDILVNCAAIVHRVDLFELDEATFSRIIDTNLRSVFWLCRGVIPGMEARNWGRIVNLTSVGVHTGGYRLTSAVYEATKAGVGSLTKTLARAFASKGILVNAVAPGAMRTRMMLDETPTDVLEEVSRDIPLGRLGEPMEVAEVIVFLAGERNNYVTGATFDANGGLVMA